MRPPVFLPHARRAVSALFLVTLVAAGCSSESSPTGGENVQVQVSSYRLLQYLGNPGVVPSATLTGPNNSATFSFTNSNDISGSKNDWHKYKFELQPGNQVTLRVNLGGNDFVSRTCTVHPRALTLTYAEMITYGPGDETLFEADTPLPPGPSVHCACGFEEYGDTRNANQCFP